MRWKRWAAPSVTDRSRRPAAGRLRSAWPDVQACSRSLASLRRQFGLAFRNRKRQPFNQMNAWQVLGCVYDGLNAGLWIGADWPANQANVCFARSGAQKLPDRNRPPSGRHSLFKLSATESCPDDPLRHGLPLTLLWRRRLRLKRPGHRGLNPIDEILNRRAGRGKIGWTERGIHLARRADLPMAELHLDFGAGHSAAP